MRIGIDYRAAVAHAPGVGRYARELVRALAPFAGNDFALALLDLGLERRALEASALGLDAARGGLVHRRVPLPRRWYALAARRTGLTADRLLGGVDLFHHVRAPFLPVQRARTCAAVSELPPRNTPQEELLLRTLGELDGVLAFSAHGAGELIDRFGVPSERVFRVPVGCDHWPRAIHDFPARAEPPELIALGAISRRRRPLALLAAFELLVQTGFDARLAFLGHAGDATLAFEEALRRSPARARVAWVREPREDELPLRVARAAALVHLSEGEETPVTPLEAFALGTPVVASKLETFEEALGRAALLIDNAALDDEPRALVPLLAAALESARDEGAAAHRRALAAPFTWHANALRTLGAWRAVLALPPRLASS